MNENSPSHSSRHSLRLIWIVAVASFLLPLMLAALFIWCEWSRGSFPNEAPLPYGSGLHGDQFWYLIQQHSGTVLAPQSGNRLQCLNVKTGEVTDPEISAPYGYFTFCWIGETHYAANRSNVYEIHDRKLTPLPPLPLIEGDPFEYKGYLTVVTRSKNGNGRLMQWKDRRWVSGGEIALPDIDWVFETDSNTGRLVLRPRPNAPTDILSGTPRAQRHLSVGKSGTTYHLYLTAGDNSFSAYRAGFDFVDTDSDDALAIDNAIRGLFGWEPVNPNERGFQYARMFCDIDGPLFISGAQVIRRKDNGSWVPLSNLSRDRYYHVLEAVDEQTGQACLIQMDHLWGEHFVLRIVGDSLKPSHAHRPEFRSEYFRRWCLFIAEVLTVWLSHLAVLAFGLWLNPRRMDLRYATRRATTAPLWRRAIGLWIDLGLLYACIVLVWIPWRLIFSIPERSWHVISLNDLLMQLQYLEWNVFNQNLHLQTAYHDFLSSPFGWPLLPLDPFSDFLGALSAICGIYIGVTTFCEGRYGFTVGKWLLSVQTTRSTLQPCGFGRSLTRRICLAIDIPFLLSPFPAFISLIRSGNTQRIGDHVADTVVVMAAKDIFDE